MNLIHWIFGKPRPAAQVGEELASVEDIERTTGKKTLRGEFLRFELARQELVKTLVSKVAAKREP